MAGWLPLFQSSAFKTVQNIGTVGGREYNFANFAKSATYTLNTNSPTVLNDDGYPASTLTDNLGLFFTLTPNHDPGGQWVISWDGTLGQSSVGWNIFSGNITVVSQNAGAVLISGGTGGSSTTLRGTDARFVVTFGSGLGTSNGIVSNVQTGCTFSSFRNLRICRLSDEAALIAAGSGGIVWNPDFLASMTTLNPGVLRLMGPSIGGAGSEIVSNAQWRYRTPLTALSNAPGSRRPYVSGMWCGAITNSGNAYTAGSYTDMPVAYVDGDQFMGTVSAAPTTFAVSAVGNSGGKIKLTISSTATLTTGDPVSYGGYDIAVGIGSYGLGTWAVTVLNATDIELTTGWQTGLASVYQALRTGSAGTISTATINSGLRGKRPILGLASVTTADVPSSGQTTFVYKSLLNGFFAVSGGLFTGLNPELAVSLCNALDKHFWWNSSVFSTQAFEVSALTYIRDNLEAGRTCVYEKSNEMWNFSFTQFNFTRLNALALDIGNDGRDSTQCAFSYQGLLTAQMVDVLQPIWSATRTASDFKPTLTGWAVVGFISSFNTYKMQGNLLNAATNSVLSAYTGGQSYNTGSPTFNRPVDKVRLVSIAPYVFSASTMPVATYITMAQQYASGSQSAAIVALDALLRAELANYASGAENIYPGYETVLAAYDAARPTGMGNLELYCYEGGTQLPLPSVSDYVAATQSVSTTVTFNVGSSPAVNWASGTPVNGTRVSFSGGTLPGGISSGTNYYVCNASPGVGFDISPVTLAPNISAAITLTGSPSGTTTGTAATYSIDNVVVGWLTDAVVARAFIGYYLAQFGATPAWPHLKRMAFLELEGFATWSLYPGDMTTTPFQTFNGIASWNAGARD